MGTVMKGIFNKKQVMLAVLIVALGVAVYLNYYFSVTNPIISDAETTTSKSKVGDVQYVNTDETAVDEANASSVDTDYFTQARNNRESARQEALDIITDLMNNVTATDETQKQALQEATAVAAAVEQESKIESLVKAKGFEDCVAYIEGDKCSIVVKSDTLTSAQALQITEIVTTQSDIVAQNVNIVTVI